MKRLIRLTVVALLLLALAVPALAAYHGTMYVNADKVNVYKEDDTSSKVIKKLKGGASVFVDDISPNGKWAQILVEDTKHGGQMLGFIQMKYLSEDMPQKYCKHNWGKWKVTKEATCTENGKRTRTCKICGKKVTETLKKTGHEWGKWKVTEEATCTEEGIRVRTCKVCGERQKESYLEEHTYGSWKITKEATCTEKGERVRTCKVCGHKDKQTLDMLPHDYEWVVTLEATDHSAGTRSKICVVCGHNGGEESFDPEGTLRRGAKGDEVRNMQQLLVEQGYLNAGGADGKFGGGTEKALTQYQKDRNLNPDGIGWPQTLKDLEHDFGPWETVKEMTRTEPGERMRVCQGCGFEQHETIESGTVFQRKHRGDDIRALQQILKQLGYNPGSVDGIYGQKLDTALASFAADHDLIVENGKVRPTDVDALVNAWISAVPDGEWMGEGSADTPVNLALTVTAAGEPDDSGVCGYDWSVTNLGSEKTVFSALMLTFGDDLDFKQDNLVMVVDGYELKPGAGNSISGRFNASSEWGEGNMNFAALGVSDATGKKWLSNAVTFEAEDSEAPRTVAPGAQEVDVNNLADGIYPVAFDRGDVLSGASGIFMNAVRIYTQDWYDIVDIGQLKVGDTIVVEGQEVPVLSLKETENGLLVNEDQDARSFYLATEEDSNGYFIRGLDDMTTFTEHGTTSLVVDSAATYTDASNIDSDPVTVGYEGIVEALQSAEISDFVPYNTTVRIEGGKVVEINRAYMP